MILSVTRNINPMSVVQKTYTSTSRASHDDEKGSSTKDKEKHGGKKHRRRAKLGCDSKERAIDTQQRQIRSALEGECWVQMGRDSSV